jgi:hypothetical protein
MSSSIDFVSALTAQPPIDLVFALSAEQSCNACHELHAAVDELRCESCNAAICPDCVRTRADASKACATCFARPFTIVPLAGEHGSTEGGTPAVRGERRLGWEGLLAFAHGPSRGRSRSSELAEQHLARAREAVLQGWSSVRSFPMRSHASSALVALHLFYGVARAEQRDAW